MEALFGKQSKANGSIIIKTLYMPFGDFWGIFVFYSKTCVSPVLSISGSYLENSLPDQCWMATTAMVQDGKLNTCHHTCTPHP